MVERQHDKVESCGSCRFCKLAGPAGPIVGQAQQYECRRRPPVAVPIAAPGGQMGMAAMFPPVKCDLWCGDYQTKGGE